MAPSGNSHVRIFPWDVAGGFWGSVSWGYETADTTERQVIMKTDNPSRSRRVRWGAWVYIGHNPFGFILGSLRIMVYWRRSATLEWVEADFLFGIPLYTVIQR